MMTSLMILPQEKSGGLGFNDETAILKACYFFFCHLLVVNRISLYS